MVMVLIGLVEYVKDLGLGVVTVQQSEITQPQISSLFWTNLLLGLFFALMMLVLAPLVRDFYGDARLGMVTPILGLTLFLGGATIQHEALLNRQMRQGDLGLMRLVSTCVSSAVAVVMALLGLSYWALVGRELSRALVYLGAVCWRAGWIPSPALRIREVMPHLKMGTTLSLSFLQTAVTRQLDVILVAKFFGSLPVGLYRQAQGLVVAPIEQFNNPIFGIAQPALSALQGSPDLYRRYYLRMVSIVAMVTMPVGVFIACFAFEFTLVALGPKWQDAAPFVGAFAAAMALRPTVYTTSFVLVSRGQSRMLLAIESAYTAVFAILMFAALHFSAIAVALAFVLATLLLVPPRLYYSLRGSPVPLRALLWSVRIPTLATATMACVLFLFKSATTIDSTFVRLAVGSAIGACTYVLVWVLLPAGRAELRAIAGHLRSINKKDPRPAPMA